MGIADWVIVAVTVSVIGLAIRYICKAKKKGRKCIGCPDGGNCGCGRCDGCDGA